MIRVSIFTIETVNKSRHDPLIMISPGHACSHRSNWPPPIEPPALHWFNAAEGWLAMNNPFEANRELDRMDPAWRIHPDVLELRLKIYTAMEQWQLGMVTANALIRLAPERRAGWVYREQCSVQINRL